MQVVLAVGLVAGMEALSSAAGGREPMAAAVVAAVPGPSVQPVVSCMPWYWAVVGPLFVGRLLASASRRRAAAMHTAPQPHHYY